MENEQKNAFLYGYIFKKKRTILIWQSNDETDCFKLDANKKLVKAISKRELKVILGEEAADIDWSQVEEMNFDNFWKALRYLRSGRSSSESTCQIILEGWNFLDDMGKTFGHEKQLDRLKTPLLNKCYDKLLYGNNLPSITPENHSYSPIWTSEEIQSMKNELRRIWDFYVEREYIGGF